MNEKKPEYVFKVSIVSHLNILLHVDIYYV